MKSIRMPKSNCPYCKHELDGATSFKNYTPSPEDVTLCLECAGICQFDADMNLIQFDLDHIEDADTKKEVLKTQALIKELHKRKQ